MKSILFLLINLLIFQSISAQTIEDAWIFFSDKPQSSSYLTNPLNMLSQRALDRRARYNISLDIKDVPVEVTYLSQVAQANGISIMAKSKWMNAVHVQGFESDIRNLSSLSFVDHIEFANKNIPSITRPITDNYPTIATKTFYDYGNGANQINMLHGEYLHQNNFTGQGVLIGIIDAGFTSLDTELFFSDLFSQSRIVDKYNFPDNNVDVYQRSMHGTGVLSTIGSQDDGNLVGTAPDALFALYISEDVNQEMPIEETYWAAAAERADSIGVDVINTSLGYMTFDRADYNYSMSDLDGQTSFVSRAATIAVSRGINVVVAAGNSGASSWPKIGFPADTDAVITVGAVDVSGQVASFSSRGPTADARVKPDVMAQGEGASVFWNGSIQNLNGTSFSSPIMAGLVACLVQANPNANPQQIKQSIIQTADKFAIPDDDYGYGIPDFSQNSLLSVSQNRFDNLIIYPNPTQQYLHINISKKRNYKIIDIMGKLVKQGNTDGDIALTELSSGIYFLQIKQQTYKFIKNE